MASEQSGYPASICRILYKLHKGRTVLNFENNVLHTPANAFCDCSALLSLNKSTAIIVESKYKSFPTHRTIYSSSVFPLSLHTAISTLLAATTSLGFASLVPM